MLTLITLEKYQYQYAKLNEHLNTKSLPHKEKEKIFLLASFENGSANSSYIDFTKRNKTTVCF